MVLCGIVPQRHSAVKYGKAKAKFSLAKCSLVKCSLAKCRTAKARLCAVLCSKGMVRHGYVQLCVAKAL